MQVLHHVSSVPMIEAMDVRHRLMLENYTQSDAVQVESNDPITMGVVETCFAD